jgi:hydroxypyruvate isomerase
MLRIDVLLDIFFRDLPFEERVAKVAECGYKHAETWQGKNAATLKSIGDACKANGIELVSTVINSDSEDAVAPVRADCLGPFLDRVDAVSDNALASGCSAGIVTTGKLFDDMTPEEHQKNLTEALRQAGELAAKKGFHLNLEPLNTIVNHPGYYLDDRDVAVQVIRDVALDNVKQLYDIYHMEIMTGNQVDFITKHIDTIGHFHAAGVPGRHELFLGETNYPFVLAKIAEASYDGFVGLEYKPTLDSEESLRKTLAYLEN